MTENLAARGEGLAGAIERCMERHPEGGQCELRRGHARQHLAGMVLWSKPTALEAAAPASTARTVGCTASDDCIHECPVSEPESRLDEFKTTVIALWDPELTAEQKKAYIASRGKELREAAALATPSPQAPHDWHGHTPDGLWHGCAEHPAATQEQPAGSEAQKRLNGYELAGCADRSGVVVYLDGRIGNSRLMVAGDWDRFAAEVRALIPILPTGYVCGMCGADLSNHPVSSSAHVCGSPRKVGEDGAGDTLWQRCLSLVERCREKTPDKWDFAHELAEICKEHAAACAQAQREYQASGGGGDGKEPRL